MINFSDIEEGVTLIDSEGVKYQVGETDDAGFYYTTPNGYTYRCSREEVNRKFVILKKQRQVYKG